MRYAFIVTGSLSDTVTAQLPELAAAPFATGGTALFGPVKDEADIMTMHARISDLGLSIIEMRRLPD